MKIKAREQAAEFLGQLLTIAYHKTASDLMELRVPDIMATIFGQPSEWQSIDYYLSLLCVIESLAQNADYREELCACEALTTNIANLLMVGAVRVINNIGYSGYVFNNFVFFLEFFQYFDLGEQYLPHFVLLGGRRCNAQDFIR